MGKYIDLSNKRFGRLIALNDTGRRTKNGCAIWNCICDCGKYTEVDGMSLRNGNTQSCGCLGLEKLKEGRESHGSSYTRLYKIWEDIKTRTTNPHHRSYSQYGGRGIKLCEEWNKFESFQKWSNDNGYTDSLTLDRIDNDKGYSPDNCRWTTTKEQARNKRTNINIEYKGTTKCLADWAEYFGLTYNKFYYQFKKHEDNYYPLFNKLERNILCY